MFTHRPFIFITLAFIAGILAESTVRISAMALIATFGIFAAATLLLARWPRVVAVTFLFAIAVLGAFGFKNWLVLPRDHVLLSADRTRGKSVIVKGVVYSDIQSRALGRGEKTSFTLAVREVCLDQKCLKKSGLVLANLFEKVDLGYGDVVILAGKIHRPLDYSTRGRLTYRSYLARQKIYLMLSVKKGSGVTVLAHEQGNRLFAGALRVREKLNGIFDKYLSPAESGLMQALITGERRDVPPHVREIFFRTGTVHILAISGMNIGMVAFGVFLILNLLPISRRWQMGLTIAIIAFYSFMAGGNSPVVRAAVTGTVFLLGFLFEREQDMLNSLAFAALCILLFLPNQIFDVGFQLSFGSVLAIILLTPLIMRPMDRVRGISENRLLRAIVESLAVSLAAMIGVSGLIAYYFQIVTPVAILANLPVIPLVGIVTAIGGGLLITGFLIPFAAPLFAVCAKVTLNLMALILYWFSLIPYGSFFVSEVSFLQLFSYYALVIGAYIGARLLIRYQSRIWPAWQMGL
jgi:competence protein ComEC